MKVQRRGGLRLRLDSHESELLQHLFAELREYLEDDDATDDDPVRLRLFPSAYPDDVAAEADYRSMTERGLRSDRIERIDDCADDLDRSAHVALADPDVARRWITVLNDLRLAMGTRLGVTEDHEPQIDPDDPAARPWLVYYWLTGMQDAVVTALMR